MLFIKYCLKKQSFLLASVLITCILFSSCKDDDDIIVVKDRQEMLLWQGMSHEWQYNHRVNRLGDWLTPNQKKPNTTSYIHTHSGASGSGSDRVVFKNYASRVQSEHIRFFHNKIKTSLAGSENSTSVVSIEVVTDIPEDMLDYQNFEVILNGFDMYPTQKSEDPQLQGDGTADKLFEFGCMINEANKTSDDQLEFDLDIKFGADCESPECTRGASNDFFDYQLTFYYIVIGYNDELHLTTKSFNNNYSWEKPSTPRADSDINEIFKEDHRLNDVTIQGENSPEWSTGLTLFKGFDFYIEEGEGGFTGDIVEHPHLLALDLSILNEEYDASSDQMTLDLDLFFKNWTAPIPFVSFGNAGAIDFNAHLTLLQFQDDVAITHNTSEGKIDWYTNPLFNDPPNTGRSLNIQEIIF